MFLIISSLSLLLIPNVRGDVNATVLDVLGGLRSACTYTGAKRLKELKKCVTFIRVTQQLNEVFSSQTTGD